MFLVTRRLTVHPRNRFPVSASFTKTIRPSKRTDKLSKMSQEDEKQEVYVLTLKTDAEHQARMDGLRKTYFPPERLKVGAHLTLFHALPEDCLASSVKPLLRHVAAETDRFGICADQISMSRNKKVVMVFLSKDRGGADEITRLRERLRTTWLEAGFLSDQDQQKSGRPHYTIMNKVADPAEVARAFDEMRIGWRDESGVVLGMTLWAYNDGFWQPVEEFLFRSVQSREL